MKVYDVAGVTVDRRTLLRLLAMAGAGASLAGCALGGGGSGNSQVAAGEKSSQNPLGAPVDAPLEWFDFDGGYGSGSRDFVKGIYHGRFPKATLNFHGSQSLAQAVQPRFVQGTPPDLCGTNGLDVGALVNQNQLTNLDPLLSAPAYDTPGKTVLQSLLPAANGFGLYDGKRFGQSFIYGVTGVWYSKTLFDQRGWAYPKTWAEMITLCGKIKAAGIAPWTFQGKYPGYMGNVIIVMAQKVSGAKLMVDVDNLVPNIWRDPGMIAGATAVQELVSKKLVLEGSSGLTHTQSQTYWAQRKAAFIPCGSWLENELGAIAPKDLGMTVAPTPSLSAGDKLPFEAIQVNAGTDYIVPAQAKNPLGAMELLRIMLSKKAATDFSQRTKEQVVVADYADNLNLSTAFKSRTDVLNKAGVNILRSFRYTEWYPKMAKDIDNATASLMNGELTPDAWSKRCQAAADAIAKDSTVKKYKRDPSS